MLRQLWACRAHRGDFEINFVDVMVPGTKIMLLDIIPNQCPSSTSVNHKNIRSWCECGSLKGTASTAEIMHTGDSGR